MRLEFIHRTVTGWIELATQSKKGWYMVTHPILGQIPWKTGTDFRTRRPLFLLAAEWQRNHLGLATARSPLLLRSGEPGSAYPWLAAMVRMTVLGKRLALYKIKI